MRVRTDVIAIYIYIYIYLYMCVCVCVFVCARVRLCVCVRVCVFSLVSVILCCCFRFSRSVIALHTPNMLDIWEPRNLRTFFFFFCPRRVLEHFVSTPLIPVLLARLSPVADLLTLRDRRRCRCCGARTERHYWILTDQALSPAAPENVNTE